MNPVPPKYQQVINPWQTPNEIRNAVAWLDRMMQKLHLPAVDESRLLCHHLSWDWSKPS